MKTTNYKLVSRLAKGIHATSLFMVELATNNGRAHYPVVPWWLMVVFIRVPDNGSARPIGLRRSFVNVTSR